MNQDQQSPRPLPHQQALIDRFCQAPPNSGHVVYWEPGLGATWTSAQIIKQFLTHSPQSRILVLIPRSMAAQIQHQLSSVGVPAQVVDRFFFRAMQDAALSGVPLWSNGIVFILGMDFARQEDIAKSLCSVPWSILIVLEAHQLRGQRKAAVLDIVKSSADLRALLLTIPGAEGIPRLGIKQWMESTTRLADVVDAKGNRLFSETQPVLRHLEFAPSDAEQQILRDIRDVAHLLWPNTRNRDFAEKVLLGSGQSSLSALEEVIRRMQTRLVHRNLDDFALLGDVEDGSPSGNLRALDAMKKVELLKTLSSCLRNLDSVAEDTKLKGFTRFLESAKATGKLASQVCILTNYVATLFCIQAGLEESGFAVYVLHGGLALEDRARSISDFKSKGGLLLATVAGMDEGLSFPEVESVVFYDPPPSRLMLQQILGRFQRFGRRVPLSIDVLNSRETIQLLTEVCVVSRTQPKNKVGILAFGSLITEPGKELLSNIAMRIKTQTPFGVEYGRVSQTRGGAPTLVPHESGEPVQGEILVLKDTVSLEEARNMLWRRERRKEGTGQAYVEGTSPNSVLVREWTGCPSVEHVLYTDFHPEGKIAKPEPKELAKRAIQSLKTAKEGMDGITYLKNNLASGIQTKLSADYEAEILRQTKASSLGEALARARKL